MKTKNSPIAPKEEIDFLFPKEGQKITIDDFKAMVKEAEKGPFFTQEEFDKEIDEWLITIPEFRAEIHKREKGEFISSEEFHKIVDEWYEKNIK